MAYFGPVNTSHHLNATDFLSTVADHVFPVMSTIYHIKPNQKSSQNGFVLHTMKMFDVMYDVPNKMSVLFILDISY